MVPKVDSVEAPDLERVGDGHSSLKKTSTPTWEPKERTAGKGQEKVSEDKAIPEVQMDYL